jgi:flavin-dependent dehydrogenase
MGTRCDVAVVGGGPAGATVAAFLARPGLLVVGSERELQEADGQQVTLNSFRRAVRKARWRRRRLGLPVESQLTW